eukprot:scaffold120870_cov36-Cyclotella_meneghiniana.AAC.2
MPLLCSNDIALPESAASSLTFRPPFCKSFVPMFCVPETSPLRSPCRTKNNKAANTSGVRNKTNGGHSNKTTATKSVADFMFGSIDGCRSCVMEMAMGRDVSCVCDA